jgi:hypothetical protein
MSDDPLEHGVHGTGRARRGRGVVHGDDERAAVTAPPARAGQRERGDRAGPQPVRVDHLRPAAREQPPQPEYRRRIAGQPRAVSDLHRHEGRGPGEELSSGLRGAVHPHRQPARLAAPRQHRHVRTGAAGHGPQHEGDPHSGHRPGLTPLAG